MTELRESMADVIARLRAEIGDADEGGDASPKWTDEELQDFLDARRTDVFLVELRTAESYSAGSVVWLDYFTPRGMWEADTALFDGSRTAIDAADYTADLVIGHWTFAASRTPPLYLSGRCYDIHSSAADVFEAWASGEKFRHIYAGDQGESGGPSRRSDELTALAREHRRRAGPGRSIVRSGWAW
jgi:hypothetical protein